MTEELTPVAPTPPLVGEVLPPLPDDDEIERLIRLAKNLAAAGIYKDVKQAAQAFAKLLIGREMGLGVAQSMQGLQFVEGQVTVHYSTLGYFVKARGFSYKFLRLEDDGVEIQFIDRNGQPMEPTSKYTIADAQKAGKAGSATYQRYPRNMLIARAMSNGVRWFVPEALGGVPVYVEGEIEPRLDLSSVQEPFDPTPEAEPEKERIELPPNVEEIIRDAQRLGHAGLADRSTWEMQITRSPEALDAIVAEARATLAATAMEAKAVPQTDPEVEVPIDTEGLPEVPDYEESEVAGTPYATEEAGTDAVTSVVEETVVDPEIEHVLRQRLTALQEKQPQTPEEESLRDEELNWIEDRLTAIAERQAQEDPSQGSLL